MQAVYCFLTSETASMQYGLMSFSSEFSELLCVCFPAFTLALVAYLVGTGLVRPLKHALNSLPSLSFGKVGERAMNQTQAFSHFYLLPSYRLLQSMTFFLSSHYVLLCANDACP